VDTEDIALGHNETEGDIGVVDSGKFVQTGIECVGAVEEVVVGVIVIDGKADTIGTVGVLDEVVVVAANTLEEHVVVVDVGFGVGVVVNEAETVRLGSIAFGGLAGDTVALIDMTACLGGDGNGAILVLARDHFWGQLGKFG
jgi:hypothetical protein